MRVPEPARVLRLLSAHRPTEKQQEMAAALPGFARIMDLAAGWDGDPKTLDLSSFTEEETEAVERDLLDHVEQESALGLQRGNLTSNLVACRSFMRCLALLACRAEVGYL